jgi:ubiquitin carboxyl-terminal hydrolase 10
VVLHHGEKAQGGHYTTRVFHAGYWLEMDDAVISSVPADKVTVCQSPVVPYLLFYRRCDLMQQS